MPFGFGDDIHAIVHAVDKIDVGMTGRSEHDPGAPGQALGGVGGEIMRTKVGFDFHDFADALDTIIVVDKIFAEQFLRDEDGIAIVKGAGQLGHRRW